MAKRNKKTDSRPEATADSRDKRVNFDNERESKFDKQYERRTTNVRKPNRSRTQQRSTNRGSSGAKRSNNASSALLAPYLKNPVVLESTARIATPIVSGNPLPCVTQQAVPGVMRLGLHFTPIPADPYVAIQAMNDQYSFVAHANSRNYNYSPETLLTMEIAGAEIFAMIGLGIRAYGLMRNYDALSVYTPDAVIGACGFNAEDLRQNYARMAGDINLLIAQSRQIWIPTTQMFVNRWWELLTSVYIDSENGRDQMYVFTPNSCHALATTTLSGVVTYNLEQRVLVNEQTGTSWRRAYTSANWTQDTMLWSSYLNTVSSLIQALIQVQDRGMIYGDLLNAYGAANIFSLEFFDDSYITIPKYDLGMLHQIMNCTINSIIPGSINYLFNLDPEQPGIPQDIRLEQTWSAPETEGSAVKNLISFSDLILNFKHSDAPAPIEVVNATRLISAGVTGIASYTVTSAASSYQYANALKMGYISAYTESDIVYNNFRVFTHGTEVITSVSVFTKILNYDYSSGSQIKPKYRPLTVRVTASSYYVNIVDDEYNSQASFGSRDSYGVTYQALFTPFDWRPNRYMLYQPVSTSGPSLVYPISASAGTVKVSRPGENVRVTDAFTIEGEFDCVMRVKAEDLRSLNIACAQSILGTPMALNLSRSTGKNMDRR